MGDADTGYIWNHFVHDASRNSSGPSASGKIPEAFQASVVVTVQPVADPVGAPYQIVGSLLRGHVEHANHAYGNHSGPDLVILFLFVRLYEFFPFGVVHALLKGDLIYKLFDWRDYLLTNFGVSL